MERQNFLYDGKAQAAAFGRPDVMGAGLIVAFPDVIDFVWRNACAVIDDFAAHLSSGFPDVDDDLFIFSAVFDRVGNQIGQHLLDLGFVAVDDDRCGTVEFYLVPLLLGQNIVGCEKGFSRSFDIKMDRSMVMLRDCILTC